MLLQCACIIYCFAFLFPLTTSLKYTQYFGVLHFFVIIIHWSHPPENKDSQYGIISMPSCPYLKWCTKGGVGGGWSPPIFGHVLIPYFGPGDPIHSRFTPPTFEPLLYASDLERQDELSYKAFVSQDGHGESK